MVMKKVTELKNKADAKIIGLMMRKRDGGGELASFVVLALVCVAAGATVATVIDNLSTQTGTAMTTKALGYLGTSS